MSKRWKWWWRGLLALLFCELLGAACYVRRKPLPPRTWESSAPPDAASIPEAWRPPVFDRAPDFSGPQPDVRTWEPTPKEPPTPEPTMPELRPEPQQPDAAPPDAMMPEPPTPEPQPEPPPPGPAAVTLCIDGAKSQDKSVNPQFDAFCRQFGALRDCKDGSCYSYFNRFGAAKAVNALIAALDTNKNKKVDAQDKPLQINIIGYAWGGITAKNVATQFLNHGLVESSRRRIDRLITINPYAPLASLVIHKGVAKLWNYRISRSSERDCSESKISGLSEGLKPKCNAPTLCRDYDYSLAPDRDFATAGQPIKGRDIGFCNVLLVSFSAIKHHVTTGLDLNNPPPPGR